MILYIFKIMIKINYVILYPGYYQIYAKYMYIIFKRNYNRG